MPHYRRRRGGLGGALAAVGPGPELLGVVLQAWFDLELGVA